MQRLALGACLCLSAWTHVVHAGLFVTSPYGGGEPCRANEPCTVEWLDDGRQPLLNVIGQSSIALYDQEKTLVQQISAAFDVSSSRSLTFIPNPEAGPSGSSYFIWITSLDAKDPVNSDESYMAFSGRFTIENMTGQPDAPIASLTSSLPLDSTASASDPSNTNTASTTNGVVSTTTLPPPPGVTPTVTIPVGQSSTLTTLIQTFTLDPTPTTLGTSSSVTTSGLSTSIRTATGTSTSSAGPQTTSPSESRANSARRSVSGGGGYVNTALFGSACVMVILAFSASF